MNMQVPDKAPTGAPSESIPSLMLSSMIGMAIGVIIAEGLIRFDARRSHSKQSARAVNGVFR